MVIKLGKKVAILVLLVGIVSIAIGGVFISQGIAKNNLIVEAMCTEKVEYGAADGAFVSIIDTPVEAQMMAGILREHRLENYGHYSELGREDPGREQILNAMTMENSLNLAQMGFGLSEVVKYTGIFMIIIGLTLGVGAVSILGSRKQTS